MNSPEVGLFGGWEGAKDEMMLCIQLFAKRWPKHGFGQRGWVHAGDNVTKFSKFRKLDVPNVLIRDTSLRCRCS